MNGKRWRLAASFAALMMLPWATGCRSELADGLPEEIECTSCHGSLANEAPPRSVSGDELTTEIGVGAHQAHLTTGLIRAALECEECHLVPELVDDEGHVDPLPAELTWGPLATADGAAPAWDREAVTCSSVYCHGATLEGGEATEPAWTTVDGTYSECNACHGDPPPPPHPKADDCFRCHADTVRHNGLIDIVGGKHINGVVDVPELECNSCHGSDVNDAPPLSVGGETDTSLLEVGAHQSHLTDGEVRAAIECSECHVEPEEIEDEGHLDDPPAELTWGPLATAEDQAPVWDREQGTCSNTYCHGATLDGGDNKTPTWTIVDGSEAKCDSCHGEPPPEPHINDDRCHVCHPGTVLENGDIDIAGGLHIDGEVQVETECNSCHGSEINDAPPRATTGSIDEGDIEVGAHQTHLTDGEVRSALACEECHIVPEELEDAGHVDDAPAEVTWGPLSLVDGATPVWDRDSATCSSTYCHGETLPGGSNTAPTWTTLDGSQTDCGTCHGAPPPAPHVPDEQCNRCHPGTVQADGTIDVAGGLHIDGVLQVETDCSSCHGSDVNVAPPESVAGSTDTADVEVGAHQSHLVDGDIRSALACEECHVVPAELDDAGHVDPAPAEVTWGPLSQTDGSEPSWDRDSASCSSTYCHGATLPGGSDTTPTWTVVDGTQSGCGSCHGNPPPLPHVPNDQCNECHPGTVLPDGTIDVAGGLHIDGVLQAATECNSCHGNDVNDAPPVSVAGSSSTGDPEVGAHQAHVTDGDIRQALACEDCHVVPTAIGDPGHIDGAPADVTWGTLATTGSVEPTWDRPTTTCSSTYCHGATLGGGTTKEPDWTLVDGSQSWCFSCHGFSPPPPHPANTNCAACHPETIAATGGIDVAGGKHINGVVDVLSLESIVDAAGCDACHAVPPPTGAHEAHYGAPADAASYGGTGITADLLPGGAAYAMDCGNCHPTDPSHHANGVLNAGGGAAEVELAPTDGPPGSLKSKNDPSAAYTPGGTLQTDGSGMAYTEGTCSSVYCHSSFEVEVPGPVQEPGTDFPFVDYPIDYPPYTVNVSRSYTTPAWGGSLTGCDGCHGYPPRTEYPTVVAGAGDSHSWIDSYGWENLHGWSMGFEPLACAVCHTATVTEFGVRTRDYTPPADGWSVYQPVPIVGFDNHVNGQPDVAFTTSPVTVKTDWDLAGSTWGASTKTCSNVSCHENDTEAVWGRPYRWWNTWECNICHQM